MAKTKSATKAAPKAPEYTGAEGLASRTAHRNVVAAMKAEGTGMNEHRRTSRGPHRGRR